MNLPAIEHDVPMPPKHPVSHSEPRSTELLDHLRQMQHGDSIVVPSKQYATYANGIRQLGFSSRSKSLPSLGSVRVWLDTAKA